MRSRLINPATVGLFVAGAVVLFRGCGSSGQETPAMPPQLIADAIPTTATSIELLYASGEASATGPVNLLKSAAQQPRVAFDLPSTATGEQRIGLVAFDNSRCLLATEDFVIYVQRQPTAPRRLLPGNPLEVFEPRSAHADVFPGCGGGKPTGPRVYTVQLSPLPSPDCRDKPVRLSAIDKTDVHSGTAVRIRGYGFHPQATVTLNGMAPTGHVDISPTLILLTVPSSLTAGKVTIRIQNPDATNDQRDDLITFS
jgi:hypothetical protein